MLCPKLPPASCVLSSFREGFSWVQFHCVHQSAFVGRHTQGHKHRHPFLNTIALFGMLECGFKTRQLLITESIFV